MKTFLLTATYAVGIGELILAIYFWITNSKSEIRRVMALLALVTAIWVIGNAIASYTNASLLVDYTLKILYCSGLLIVVVLVHLSLIYPFKIINIDRYHRILLYTPAVMISYLVFFSKAIIVGYEISPLIPGNVIPGPAFSLFNIVIALYFFAYIIITSIRISNLDGINRKNTILLLISVVVGGLFAIVGNILYSFSTIMFNPLVTVIPSIAWVAAIIYIVNKS